MSEEQIKQKFAKWTQEYDPKKIMRIDQKLVHKHNNQNNFVSRIEEIQRGDMDIFIAQVAVDPTHPYFFEHAYDHVPGLLMVVAI